MRIDRRLAARGKDNGAAPGYAALRAGLHDFHVRILREAPGPPTALEWESDSFARQPIPDSLFNHIEAAP